jgi:hypothetical protein
VIDLNNAKKVEDNADLVRDPYSHAIVNTNESAYRQAVAASKAAKAKNKKLEDAEKDINNIKQEMSEIKGLLQELLNRV